MPNVETGEFLPTSDQKLHTQTACREIRDMCKRRLRAGVNNSCEWRYFNLFSICLCQ